MVLKADAESHPRLMTAEHLIPAWMGGPTREGNIVAACYECNNTRDSGINQTNRETRFTIGDDAPSSPFAQLRGLFGQTPDGEI